MVPYVGYLGIPLPILTNDPEVVEALDLSATLAVMQPPPPERRKVGFRPEGKRAVRAVCTGIEGTRLILSLSHLRNRSIDELRKDGFPDDSS